VACQERDLKGEGHFADSDEATEWFQELGISREGMRVHNHHPMEWGYTPAGRRSTKPQAKHVQLFGRNTVSRDGRIMLWELMGSSLW